MNWLIITGKKDKRHTDALTSFFDTKKVNYTILKADTRKFTACHESSFKNFKELHGKIDEATHCICLDTSDIPLSPLFMYAAGLFAGKKIPVFLVPGAGNIPDFIVGETGTLVSDVDDLLETLKKDFPIYVKLEVQEKVRKKLFKLGIPLTPDSFSNYIARGDENTASLFPKAGMDVSIRDSAGTPMLCIAVRCNKPALVNWLIEQGADIDAASEDRGYTALMDAVWKNNYEVAETLVKAGARLDTVAKDGQPLMVLAAGISNIKICRLLFENGGDVCMKDRMGLSALDYARVFKNQIPMDLFSSGRP
ncbi:ankyrin repeat domain-containing protein [Treponema sp. HNW]|uniref:ankyrin repeat domain-containing protein n=1 Tax=Treponema sp. HNW TaxID=3116654 RepID=UPI003D0AE4E8